MPWELDKETGMSWTVGREYKPTGLITNIVSTKPQEKYTPYKYERMENGEIGDRLKQAVDFFSGKEPEDIVRLLIRKFGDR